MTDFLATRGRFKDCKEVRRLGSPQIPPWPNRKTAATGRDNGKKNLNHPITVAKMPSGHIQLANTYPRRGPRDILPVELWAIIKTFIHPSDLLTHVSFFVVTESIADVLYGNPQRQAAFWEALCLSNGLGCVAQDERNEETGAPNVPWGVVAIECAQNAVHCHHPECGLARLRENVECMELIGHKYSSWDEIFRLNMLMNATRGRLQIPDHTCLVNPLLKQIMFEREHEQSAVPSDATEESYLRPYDEETVPSRLCDHPIALRSFATFPPMLGMFFMGEMIPGLGFKACSQLGVTVDSFVREIHKQLDIPYSVSETVGALRNVDKADYDLILGSTQDPLNVLAVTDACSTLRGYLSLFRFDDIFIEAFHYAIVDEVETTEDVYAFFNCELTPARALDVHDRCKLNQ